MCRRTKRLIEVLVVFVLLPVLHGCWGAAAAGGAAAGTAAGLAYSERGAEADVRANPSNIARATNAVFRDRNITVTETERDDDDNGEMKIEGKKGERDVVVDIHGNTKTGTSHVEVTVKKNAVDYDRDEAKEILADIMKRL